MDALFPASLLRIERRLSWMRELATSLQRAQQCVLEGRIEQLEDETRRQQKICERLHEVDAAFHESVGPGAENAGETVPPQSREHWQVVALELVAVENQVRHLNRVHAAILRRARQSLAVLSQVVASCGPTYEVPAPTMPLSAGGR